MAQTLDSLIATQQDKSCYDNQHLFPPAQFCYRIQYHLSVQTHLSANMTLALIYTRAASCTCRHESSHSLTALTTTSAMSVIRYPMLSCQGVHVTGDGSGPQSPLSCAETAETQLECAALSFPTYNGPKPRPVWTFGLSLQGDKYALYQPCVLQSCNRRHV